MQTTSSPQFDDPTIHLLQMSIFRKMSGIDEADDGGGEEEEQEEEDILPGR
jgi:hypothetical protein